MEWRDLAGICWVLVLCSASTSARSVNETKDESSSLQGGGTCFYNGTWYQEKEELPTRGLCLICHCFPGFTEPNAFTCSVIDCPWEDYHRRFPGCTPIYADRDCCPIGWECDYGTQNPGQQHSKDPDCDCEWRYLKHYEAKGCRPVYEEKPDRDKPDCACPWRFDCSQADDVNVDETACMYKKHVYPVGSKIPTTNPCEACSCTTDYFTQAASISCTTIECPSVYSQTPIPEGCHYVYKENECCPKSVECPAAQKDDSYKVPMCEYKGKMYYEGEQMYPDEDPCLICLCGQNWTGVNSRSCRQHDCMMERDARKLKQGCIPIYHEKTCCPIDYHCADEDFDFKSNRGANFKSDEDEDEMCHFEGRYYSAGHTLDIQHPTHCVTCTCKTPPDFTCIHSSCPPPPNGDYANCRAVYKPNACCPDYKCHEKKDDSGNTTKVEETTEETSEDAMQMLIQECKKMECASDERCMLVEQKCQNETCLPVARCEKVSFGCGQSSCPEGCQKIGSYEGDCPLCHCTDPKEPQYQLTCRVQSCEENCVLSGRDPDGCPVCKCPQGNLEERACAPSTCQGYNCTMAVNSLGCAECRCRSACKPDACPAGCDPDPDSPQESGLHCGCVCHNSSAALEHIHSTSVPEACSPVSCSGFNCTIGKDRADCPTCSCAAPCPAPECQEGCRLEKEAKEPGRCPSCVCKLSRSARDNAASDCPPPTCLGYNCSVMEGEDGCQKCQCESPCEESPQCPSHCQLETDVPEGRCRGCICSYGETTDSDGRPLRGGGKVPGEEEGDMEPEKREDIEADFIPMPGKDIVPSELESGRPDDPKDYEEASEDRHEEEYGEAEDSYEPEYAEEKTLEREDEKCKAKKCPEGQKCVIRRLQCIRTPCPTIPVCIDVEPRCPIPMCSIGCMVMKWDDEVCPSCFCGIIRGAEGRVCPRTRCIGRRCYNVIGDDGCPTCKCDSICIPPTCADGCWIETDPPEGKCPTCTCPSRSTVVAPIIPASPTAEAYGLKQHQQHEQQQSTKAPLTQFSSYHCPTPHCNGYNCSLIRGSDGCQKCVCDSPCAPCPQHCVKTKTLSEGRCPICDCTVAPTSLSESARQCPVTDCGGANCRKVRDNDGCYACICDPKCADPKCDPGCEVLTDVPPGQCPGCVCRVTVVQAVVNRPKHCPQVQCSTPDCRVARGPDGCQYCVCDACPPPKCDPGCELQTDVAQGECPTCVCPNFNDQEEEEEEEEHYCPNLFCSDYGCREVPGPAGCPICMCDPICATPVCEPGCQVVTNKYGGRCPVCICSSPLESESQHVNLSESSFGGLKQVPVSQQQQQHDQVTFSGIFEPVVAEEDSYSTLHTTITVDVEPTEQTTTAEPTTTEPTTTTTEPPATCPAPVCSGLRCSYETGEDGCEVCKCRYKCPQPKCVGNCYPETNYPSHRCPGCVCPSRRKPALTSTSSSKQ